jgi:hypothetical protein
MVFFPGRRWRSNAVPRNDASPPYGHFIELELNGTGMGWTYVSLDVLTQAPLRLSYGIQGGGPGDLVAPTGTLSWAMNNSEENSAGTIGYYSPDGPNCRPGFKRGIGVRYRYRVPGTFRIYTKFSGRLLNADPTAGVWDDRRVACDAGDWMLEAGSILVSIPTQINKRANELVTLIVAAVPRQPAATQFDTGISVFPYSFDNSRSENNTALALIQQACASEYTFCYLRGGLGLPGMVLRLENRTTRLTPIPVATFTGTQQGLKPSALIRNRAKVTVHPRRVDATNTTVLFAKPDQSNPPVNPGETIKITIRYTDPTNRASRVGGTDMIPLAATTDYLANAAPNGLGADLTASAAVVASLDANQAIVSITNTGGVVLYVTKLQGRGRGLYDYDPLTADQSDAASIAEIGESLFSLDMPFQSDFAIADAIAAFLVDTLVTPGSSEIKPLRFIPADDAEMELAMSLEPGDPIAVTEEVTAINGVFYIQGVTITVDGDKAVFEWGLKRALVQNYWTLGIAGFSELGINTVLAPL